MNQIVCIGAVLWDIIGRTETAMPLGADRPGRITRIPGGVAMNIALTLARLGVTPVLLTALGRDHPGDELINAAQALGMVTDHIHRSDRPTDTYMAIESGGDLTAAIADAHSLEAAGDAILAPLLHGPLGHPNTPFDGVVALDGNLTHALLAEIATHPAFARADLRVAPASPGKIDRLMPFLNCDHATIYINLEEANALSGTDDGTAPEAVETLSRLTKARVLVTDGPRIAAMVGPGGVLTAQPPEVTALRVTGAGDTFMAAHIVAERSGQAAHAALPAALETAARFVSGAD